MRRAVLILLSILVSAAFLWLALRDVDLADVGSHIAAADPAWMAVCFVSVFFSLWTRAVRWRGLVAFKISPRDAFHIVNVTFLVNQLPLRAGEVARSLLTARDGVPILTAATAIVVERLLDTLLVVVLIALALTRLPGAPPSVTAAAGFFGAAAVAAFALLLLFARRPAIAHRLLDLAERPLPVLKRLPLRGLVDNALEGLRLLNDPRRFAHTAVTTLIGWAFSLITLYSLHRALGIDGVDLLVSSLLAMALASLSIAIPVSVASIGPFEGAVRVAGEMVAMPAEQSASLGILFHGVAIVSYTLLGVIGLVALGVSLGDVLARKSAPPEPRAAESPAE